LFIRAACRDRSGSAARFVRRTTITSRFIPDPITCAEAVVEYALAAGSRDNCTCAVIAFESGPLVPPEGMSPPR
jgi:hypothetical protein